MFNYSIFLNLNRKYKNKVVCNYRVTKITFHDDNFFYGYGKCKCCGIKISFDSTLPGTMGAAEWNEKEKYYGSQHSAESCFNRQ